MPHVEHALRYYFYDSRNGYLDTFFDCFSVFDTTWVCLTPQSDTSQPELTDTDIQGRGGKKEGKRNFETMSMTYDIMTWDAGIAWILGLFYCCFVLAWLVLSGFGTHLEFDLC